MPPAFRARIDVMLKPVVNDPQGLAVRDGLRELGFASVDAVRVGKHIEVTLEADDAGAAAAAARSMCERLLANEVIETFALDIGSLATA